MTNPKAYVRGAAGPVKHSGHLGMAVKLAGLFVDQLLYVNGVGWHCWDGKRFARDADGAARRAVHAMLKRDREIVMRLNLPDRGTGQAAQGDRPLRDHLGDHRHPHRSRCAASILGHS